MRLKKIKQLEDKYLTKYIIQEKTILRKLLNLDASIEIFYLGYFYSKDFFLYKDKILISDWTIQHNKNNKDDEKTIKITECYSITLLKEYPQNISDIDFKVILIPINNFFTTNNFLEWIDRPSNITEEIDLPFYKIIKFLQNYKPSIFKTKNYLFYSKEDKDFSRTFNIYAQNLKTKKEIKLYFPDKLISTKNITPPQSTRDIVADPLTIGISDYEILKCKKEYLEYSKQYFKELETTNHCVLKLLKQVLQPVEENYEICAHRVFTEFNKDNKQKTFTNLWVLGFSKKDEKPSFFLTDEPLFKNVSKIAVINFKTPTYHLKTIFKNGLAKYKRWILDKEYIKKLIEFLNSPANLSKHPCCNYSKYVKTNWQKLILEYNLNTVGWTKDGSNSFSDLELLPFDLSMPDYLKLLDDI